jgi:hypothetical protein
MRKSFVALLLLGGASAALASNAFARAEELGGDVQSKLVNAQMARELRSAVARPGVSNFTGDTVFVGFVPGKTSAANYWSIGIGKAVGYPREVIGAKNNDYGMWTWDNDDTYPAGGGHPAGTHNNNIGNVHGDSLYGWWPYRNLYTSTGGLTLNDDLRPWWAIDIGNNANYVINQGAGLKRTFGIVGVWHKDVGNTGAGAGKGVDWTPLAGSQSLWCGLRRHGDLTVSDDPARGGTGNPFNAQVLANSGVGATPDPPAIGTAQKFPGYGSQWDQLAYRDIDVTGKSSVTVRFKMRTNMSTAYGTATATRTGWFDKDPLGPADQTNVNSLNNFISSSAAGAGAPIDSFMVYVGAGVGYAKGSNWKASDGVTYQVYDPQRRWLSETLRVNERPTVPYYEVYTTYGDNATTTITTKTATVSATWNNKARIVFRNKTNRGFDDEGGSQAVTSYSSLGRGAVVIDDIEVDTGTGFTTLVDFETAGDVDNSTSVDPIDAMKTTGKPEGVFDHVHNVDDLIYEDLCGLPGARLRVCNLDGNVISSGDHDHSERAGGVFGTASQELNNSFFSPTIQLVNHGGTNVMDLDGNSAEPTEDYYILYDIYTGIYDFTSQGNAWRFGFQSYPGKQVDGTLCWADWRFPGFIIFNPDKQCFQDIEGAYQNALMRFSFADTEDPGFYPDSIRIMLGKVQQCFRFGLPSANCSPTDGSYWDNVSFTIIDGIPAPMSIDIWQLINDTFTVNGGSNRSNVVPGSSDFDTTTALVKIGLNIAQTTNTTTTRYNVPGDTTTVNADGDGINMHMVFRINPGPGNYTTIGTSTSSLRRVPTSTTPVNIGAPVAGPNANFWEQYLLNNGAVGTPGGHPAAGVNGGKRWSNLVWNSARCDTAEVNLYTIASRNIGLPAEGLWSSMYIEQDPKFTVMGIEKNRCFLKTATNAVTQANTTCNLSATPTDGWEVTSGYTTENGLTHGHTFEYTKIMPDGQFTPGTHVQYFFERVDNAGSGGQCEGSPCFAPDTSIVFPQGSEGSTDAHRWQQFSVLPDAWKFDAYGGLGQACMLYVDLNDRRGNERVWVSIADSLGATNVAKYGAHNGWHAPGTGSNAVNDPSSFVYNLNEQPGSSWDMFGTKASESLNSKSGTIGAWNSFHGSSAVDFKWSYQGPSIGMLTAYYKILLILSGDLNSTIIGPGLNFSANDALMIQDFLADGTSGDHRGVFIEGDGFVEAAAVNPQKALMTNWFKVSLRDPSYLTLTKNDEQCADLVPSLPISNTDIYGVRNGCLFTDDVLQVEAGGAQSARYSPNGIASAPVVAGVFHDASDPSFYQSVVDGWDIENLRSRYCDGPRGRQWYYYQVLNNIFSKICAITGSGGTPNDVPNGGAQEFVDFMNLRNNPLVAGQATVELGISRADRVEVKVFDVSGRLVRTLADRQFAPGKYTLTWDGVDNSGRQVARGVYFTQVKYVNSRFTDARKLTVLK